MLNSLLGTKIDQTQTWTEAGMRLPVTRIQAGPCLVTQLKTQDKDGYAAVQLGFGTKKREVRVDSLSDSLKPNQTITAAEVFHIGDLVNVTGTSRGKGFTGVVKRHGFKGGPKTHGQSDRHRAPGSIGQGTDPGRVHKGKRMAGRMGGDTVTIRNLTVVKIEPTGEIWLKGIVPGTRHSLVTITKII